MGALPLQDSDTSVKNLLGQSRFVHEVDLVNQRPRFVKYIYLMIRLNVIYPLVGHTP